MAVKMDDLFVMISSTAESIKILADTDLPQVKEVLYQTNRFQKDVRQGLQWPSSY